MQMCVPSKSAMSETPSISYSRRSLSSTVSHLLSLLESVSLPSCSLSASPCMEAVILHYCTFQGTVLYDLKCFIFCVYCFLHIICSEMTITQSLSCVQLCDPMDCNLPGSSVHGILQAKILEWVAISSSRGSSLPRDQTCISFISCIHRWILYH